MRETVSARTTPIPILHVARRGRRRGPGADRGVSLLLVAPSRLAPLALSFIVTGVVWRWLLNPGSAELGSTGINLLLDTVGLGFLKTGWYTDPKIGIKAVVVAATWQMSGYVMAMYLAGLRGIPEELREAALVDGASEFQVYRHIIVPLLHPLTLGAMIILGHISLKIFDLVVAMPGPGPGFSSDVPAFFMFA